jgi:two-component sensor histidine kinase
MVICHNWTPSSRTRDTFKQSRPGTRRCSNRNRPRNLISVVGATVEKILRTSKAFDDFKASFRDRIGALGRVQGLLFRMKEDDRVTFDELIETELAAHPFMWERMDRSRSTDREAFGCAQAQSRPLRLSRTSS